MLKRQDSSLSASRRQSTAGTTPPTPETHHAKAIGCMSGIFQLFSKYQNPNKRLTFGKKQEKRKQMSPTSSANASAPLRNPQSSIVDYKTETQRLDANRLTSSIKVPRSPTLPPEIRRSSSPENSRTPQSSSLVARLMGLEDIGAAAKKPGFQEDPIIEKRQRLLQALEKCNEDLEELKRIIKAVQKADVRLQPPPAKPCREKCTETSAEEPNIPVDELTRSSLSSYSTVQNAGAETTNIVPPLRNPTTTKKPGEDDEPIGRILNKSAINESSVAVRRQTMLSPAWSSRAMVESVEEVCRDIAWGEKREIGRIGLVVQDHLCRELIEEVVKDFKSCSIIQPLPLEACKRKLCF